MFLESFKITGFAVFQIFILGVLGYVLVKRDILGESCLDSLSRLTIDVTLPALIFCQLIKDFSFSAFSNWWIFPLISVGITALGFMVAGVFCGFVRGNQRKLQFLSLVTFQNSGYLPLALIAALLPKEKADSMFIYLFLFLLGFNIIMFSFGSYLVSFSKEREFELASLFSPPVIATFFTLVLVYAGFNKVVPDFIFRPLKLVGDCTLPLAMFVVGGNLAQIKLGDLDLKSNLLMILAKLVILPGLGLLFLAKFKMPELVGLLIIIELAAPPATLLSVITRHHKKEDLLIGQGLFFGHIFSLLTLPVFLSLFFSLPVIK